MHGVTMKFTHTLIFTPTRFGIYCVFVFR